MPIFGDYSVVGVGQNGEEIWLGRFESDQAAMCFIFALERLEPTLSGRLNIRSGRH